MQTSKKDLSPKVKNRIEAVLFQTITDLKNSDEVRQFLSDLLSEVELEVIAKRLAIVYRLEKGESYDQIKNELQTSSTTVAAMADQLKKSPGLRLALRKIRADEWAEKWSAKIERLFANKGPITHRQKRL